MRIDHPDGLSDPAGYLTWLRELAGPEAWIVIEKILAVDEALEPTLPVAGTTGYDSLREVGGLFVDPTGAEALTALYESTGIDYSATPAVLRDLKAAVATDTLGSELARLCRAIVTAAGADHPQLPDAVAALLGHIDVYRFDYPGLAAIAARPRWPKPILSHHNCGDRCRSWPRRCARGGEPDARLQQLCGAVDREVGRGLPVLSRRSPGLAERSRRRAGPVRCRRGRIPRQCSHPGAVMAARDDDADHPRHQTRRRRPGSHRGAVAGAVVVGRVRRPLGDDRPLPRPRHRIVSVAEHLRGRGRPSGEVTDELRDRLHGYAEKSIREAALHTIWNDPDTDFEDGVHGWVDSVLDGPVAAQLTELVNQLNTHAESDALGQKLLALTAPGIPDVYQGTELWDDSLVDPDNRRAVDYATRRERIEVFAAPKNSHRQRGAADAARPAGHLLAGSTFRCSPPESLQIMWWRSVAVMMCWLRRALDGSTRRNRLGRHRCPVPDGFVDRCADRQQC